MKEGRIHVAVGRIRLDLPGCNSLKLKRKVIRPLVKRIRDRFGVSASEVGHHDLWRSSVIVVAAAGGDASQLAGLVHDVVRFVERYADAVLVEFGVEVLSVGRIQSMPPPGRDQVQADVVAIERKWLDEEEP